MDAAPKACVRCGDYPESALSARSPDLCARCIPLAYARPWSPGAIAMVGFWLGIGGAGVLHALNGKRFAEPHAVLPRIAAWLIAYVAMIALLWFVSSPLAMLAAIPIQAAVAIYFGHARSDRFELYVEHGGRPGSVLAAIGVGIATSVVVIPMAAIINLVFAGS